MTCPQTVPLQSRLIMSLEIRLVHLFLLFYYLSYVQDFLLFLFWFQSRFNFVSYLKKVIKKFHAYKALIL